MSFLEKNKWYLLVQSAEGPGGLCSGQHGVCRAGKQQEKQDQRADSRDAVFQRSFPVHTVSPYVPFRDLRLPVLHCSPFSVQDSSRAAISARAAEQVWSKSFFCVYRGALEILFLPEPIARSGQTSTHRWQPTQRLPSSTGLRSFPRRIAW